MHPPLSAMYGRLAHLQHNLDDIVRHGQRVGNTKHLEASYIVAQVRCINHQGHEMPFAKLVSYRTRNS